MSLSSREVNLVCHHVGTWFPSKGKDAFRTQKETNFMPKKKPLKGVSDKEERQYEHIKESAEKGGRYGDRAAEVAARTVMKQHKEKGHKKGQ